MLIYLSVKARKKRDRNEAKKNPFKFEVWYWKKSIKLISWIVNHNDYCLQWRWIIMMNQGKNKQATRFGKSCQRHSTKMLTNWVSRIQLIFLFICLFLLLMKKKWNSKNSNWLGFYRNLFQFVVEIFCCRSRFFVVIAASKIHSGNWLERNNVS